MEYPIRNQYSLKITLKRWLFDRFLFPKYIYIKYAEATLSDLDEFEKSDRIDWLVNLINKNNNIKKDIPPNLYMYAINEIFSKIFNTFIVFSWNDEKSSNNDDKMPESSYIIYICKYLSIWVNNLVSTYTLRQLKYISNGIIRNENEKTPEWQKKNKKLTIQPDIDNIDYELLNKARIAEETEIAKKYHNLQS